MLTLIASQVQIYQGLFARCYVITYKIAGNALLGAKGSRMNRYEKPVTLFRDSRR